MPTPMTRTGVGRGMGGRKLVGRGMGPAVLFVVTQAHGSPVSRGMGSRRLVSRGFGPGVLFVPHSVDPRPFFYFRRRASSRPVVVVAVDIEAAIIAMFRATASLSALSGTYMANVPRQPTLPFLVISHVGAYPQLNSSASFWETYSLQFTVVSDDFQAARNLGWAAYTALNPKVPGALPLTFQDGYLMVANPGMHRHYSVPGASSAAQVLHHWMFTYDFLIGRGFVPG